MMLAETLSKCGKAQSKCKQIMRLRPLHSSKHNSRPSPHTPIILAMHALQDLILPEKLLPWTLNDVRADREARALGRAPENLHIVGTGMLMNHGCLLIPCQQSAIPGRKYCRSYPFPCSLIVLSVVHKPRDAGRVPADRSKP